MASIYKHDHKPPVYRLMGWVDSASMHNYIRHYYKVYYNSHAHTSNNRQVIVTSDKGSRLLLHQTRVQTLSKLQAHELLSVLAISYYRLQPCLR